MEKQNNSTVIQINFRQCHWYGREERSWPGTKSRGRESSRVSTILLKLISFLAKSKEEKESDLECSVCYETAGGRIFCCVEQHLVCSQCRPRVSECPQCRQSYPPTPIRHRYAEKSVRQLERLREELGQVVSELYEMNVWHFLIEYKYQSFYFFRK